MKTIYKNGKVYTGEMPFQSAFVVEEGRFLHVGNDEEILGMAGPSDEIVDLEGRFVCAGLIDSHMHVVNFGYALQTADLSVHSGSMEDMLQALRDFADANPSLSWICGRGWNQDYFSGEKRFPTRLELDRVSQDHPICVIRACGHICVVNTKALELIGVTQMTPQPEGGQFDLGEDGKPNGIFRENGTDLVYSHLPEKTCEDIKEMILAASSELNRYGITSVHTDDLLVFHNVPYERILQAYQELTAEGRMTVRVYEQSQFTDVESLRQFVERGYHTGVGDAWFKIGPLKMLGDGSLGARTAYLSEPYEDDKTTRGIAVFTRQQFEDMIGYAHTHGMQVAIHAIGDGILDDILAGYETALKNHPNEDHRHGIVHCQIMRPDQLDKFEELNLHAYIQPIFLDYDIHIVEDRVGKMRAASSYVFRSLFERVHASGGSDCPVELPRALAGIQCAVTRCSVDGQAGPYLPEQAMCVQQAIDSFTVEGAHGSFEEDVKGRIAPGMYADFVVLGQSPFEVAPERISEIPVVATFVDGICRFHLFRNK